jgi:Peptidase family M49
MRRLLAVFFPMALALAAVPDLAELNRMIARFAPAPVTADTSKLAPGDRQALAKIIDAANVVDAIFREQLWAGNPSLKDRLAKDTTPLGRARDHYYRINNGPWSDLDEHAAFVPEVPAKKPAGANFYPDDMTKPEFEEWLKRLPKPQQEEATGFFTVIRRGANKALTSMPYSQAYAGELARAAALLNQAADLTPNESLKTFLHLRAQAFLSNDYYSSDVAWMNLDAPIDVTIGPYETYNDDIFGYKASFEAYVTLRDEQETAKLKMFADHIQEIENNLPLEAKYRNPKLGALAPIRVVNEILATGDGAHGVRTAAFNLPNDERIVKAMGSKRVMLKNVQEAKFKVILEPIAARVLAREDQSNVKFDAFFTHILAHEMTHGIGPQNGVRQALKELHAAIEEAKADQTGLFMMQYLFDHKLLPEAEKALYATFLASSFRTLRFGVHEAHGRGMALQFNYLTDKGALVAKPDGTFAVEPSKIKNAVRDLVHDLLEIEATGDYARARQMLDTLGNLRPAMQKALDRLKDLPTDIEPVRS